MASKFLIALVSLVLAAYVVSAQQFYKWKDNKGQWHFSDNPPPEIRAEKVKGFDIGPVPPVAPQIVAPQKPSAGSQSKEKAVSKPRLTKEISREQRDYQKRLEELMQQIKALKDRIEFKSRGFSRKLAPGEAAVVTGSGRKMISPYPKEPARPGVISPTSPARSITPRDSSMERELDRLGNQLGKLYEQRDALVREMGQRGIETGYIP